MSASEWATFAVALMTIMAGFIGLIRWLVKHYLSELKPNSGSSIKDQVNALQVKVDLIYDIVTAKRR